MSEHLSLEKVSKAFAVWRQTRTKKGKIPDYLIEQILQLKGHPPYLIARKLGINSNSLKAMLKCPKKIDFIPLPRIPYPESKISCTLSRNDGAHLKLELMDHQIADFLRIFLCSK